MTITTNKSQDLIRLLAIENNIQVQAVETAAALKYPALVRHNQPIPEAFLPAFMASVGEAISRMRRSA